MYLAKVTEYLKFKKLKNTEFKIPTILNSVFFNFFLIF